MEPNYNFDKKTFIGKMQLSTCELYSKIAKDIIKSNDNDKINEMFDLLDSHLIENPVFLKRTLGPKLFTEFLVISSFEED